MQQRLQPVPEYVHVPRLPVVRLEVVHGVAHVDGAVEVVVHEEAGDAGEVLPGHEARRVLERRGEGGDGEVLGGVAGAEDGHVERAPGLLQDRLAAELAQEEAEGVVGAEGLDAGAVLAVGEVVGRRGGVQVV